MANPLLDAYRKGGGAAGFSSSAATSNPLLSSYRQQMSQRDKVNRDNSVIARLNKITTLKTPKEQYDLLREARKLGLITQKEQQDAIKTIGNNQQIKIAEAAKPHGVLENVGSFINDMVAGPAVNMFQQAKMSRQIGYDPRLLSQLHTANAAQMKKEGLSQSQINSSNSKLSKVISENQARVAKAEKESGRKFDPSSGAMSTIDTVGNALLFKQIATAPIKIAEWAAKRSAAPAIESAVAPTLEKTVMPQTESRLAQMIDGIKAPRQATSMALDAESPSLILRDATGIGPRSNAAVEDMVNAYRVGNTKLLDTINSIPGIRKLARVTESRTGVIKSMGEAGQEFAARTNVQEILHRKYIGEVDNLLKAVKKASGKNYKNVLTQAVREIKATTTDEARANLKGLAKQIADMQDARRQQLIDQGIDIGKQQGYFTDMIKPGMEGEAREYIRNAISDNLVKAVKEKDFTTLSEFGLPADATAAEIRDAALKAADGDITSLNIIRSKNGQVRAGVEYTKTHLLPDRFYETDPATILSNWANETGQRLASSQVFGKSDEVAAQLLRRIGDTNGIEAQNYAMDLLEKQRFGAPRTAFSGALQNVRGYQMLAKMGMSSITNAGQVANKFTVFGGLKTARAYKAVIADWGKYMKLANERGVGLTDLTDSLMEKVYAGGKKSPLITASGKLLDINGFKTVETMHRLADVKLADDLITKMSSTGLDSRFSRNWMRRLGLNHNEIVKQGINESNRAAITRQVVDAIDFYVDPKDIAGWTTSGEVGKTVSQLGKFSIKQGGHIAKQVVNEAAHGNFIPALRWMVGAQVVGATVIGAKNLITGKKRENSIMDAISSLQETLAELEQGDIGGAWEKSGRVRQYAGQNLAQAGGLGYIYDLYKGLDYGNSYLEKAISALGPTASDVVNIFNTYQKLNEGKPDDAIRGAVKFIPGNNIVAPNIDRFTGGSMFTFNPKGSAVFSLNDQLGKNEKLTVSREDADAFGKSVDKGTVAKSAVIDQIARKLYDKNGKEALMDAKSKAALTKFLADYKVTNAKQIAIDSYKQSSDNSKTLSQARKKLSDPEKEIVRYFNTGAKASEYLKQTGRTMSANLKEYYKIREQ